MSRIIKRNDSKNFQVEILTAKGPLRVSTGSSDLEAAKRFAAKLKLFENAKENGRLKKR